MQQAVYIEFKKKKSKNQDVRQDPAMADVPGMPRNSSVLSAYIRHAGRTSAGKSVAADALSNTNEGFKQILMTIMLSLGMQISQSFTPIFIKDIIHDLTHSTQPISGHHSLPTYTKGFS